jgi:hypothetical protein
MALPLASAGLSGLRRRSGIAIQDPDLTLVLRGGRLFQAGTWRTCDVGVDSSGKLRFGSDLRAAESLDVSGKVVAPGFIDILADNGENPAVTFPIFEKYKVSDGVTTALQMHGGSADCAAHYERFAAFPHQIHYGVSTFVMAIRNRTTGFAVRRGHVERNLAEGALGVSHSLEYQPTPFEEVLEYAKLARKYDRPFFLHLRYSSQEGELAGVDEAIRLARASGARLHIDHLHSTGGTFRMEAALEKLRAGIADGLSLTTCVYPYSYWATYLASRRFDPGWQERYGLSYGDLRLVGSGECLTPASFAQYRKTRALVAVPEGTLPLARTLDLALREDFCMIGSDGGIQREPRANSHPRGAGCFSTAIRHALDIGMPLERILEKMTVLPRRVMLPAMKQRGLLEEGAAADLTVFDPGTIRGNATVENPNQFSSGVELVLVNGKIAYRPGTLAARNGTAIRY